MHSLQTKEKIRQRQLASWKKGNRKGHPITEETKRKISEKNKISLKGNIPANRLLTQKQVETIRYFRKKGYLLKQLAKTYKTSVKVISDITNYRTYGSKNKTRIKPLETVEINTNKAMDNYFWEAFYL